MAAKPSRRRWAASVGRQAAPNAAAMLPSGLRRLEPRRMLDAAAGALALELFDASTEFVQAGPNALPPDVPDSAALSGNTNPSNIQIQPMSDVDENGVALLALTFDDPDANDTHTVAVNWGEGPTQFYNVAAGSHSFSATHQYLDDNPTVTPADKYTVNVKVIDAFGGSAVAAAPVLVRNVAPSNLQFTAPQAIDENGVGSLEFTFDDPGSLDVHTVEVQWGDNATETFTLPQGARSFSATHQYLDDDPTDTAADDVEIKVRVLDDDGGELSGKTAINVRNVAPSNVQMKPIAPIDEHGVVTLELSFDDPGSLDVHHVEVTWAPGVVELLPVSPGARTFTATHQYLDDDPSNTDMDSYPVSVRVLDDDRGVAAAGPATALVRNVAPAGVTIDPLAPIDENGVAMLSLAFTDPGTLDAHTVEIDWGDGSALDLLPVSAGARTFSASHQYLDDNAADSYAIAVRVLDDDLGVATASATVAVTNVPPGAVQVTPAAAAVNEGAPVNLSVQFDDPGTLDEHSYEVDWGDGTAATFGSAAGHGFTASHVYADDGVYKATVKVFDDDAGVGTATATITVSNVAPTLSVVGNQAVNEGSLLSLPNVGTFTDPGFDNPLNPLAEKSETFTFTIDWGDGTADSAGAATVDALGSPGVLTAGSFDGSHTYADDGLYTVTITVLDDDGGQDVRTFSVTVSNVAPTLSVVGNQAVNEGSLLSLPNVGTFTDPGFDNPLNPLAEKSETFTFTIDWGDGTADSAGAATVDALGSPGVLTAGSFDGSHTYADDGLYTVTVTVLDDDGGQDVRTFSVTVSNVAPTLSVVGNQAVSEGSLLSLPNVGTFTDPGFDNPLNPLAEKSETFTFTIDWGDGTADSAGAATVDALGSPGVLTAGSFDGSHTYADDGLYTVTVTVLDDDGGQDVRTFSVTVSNVAPTLSVVGNQAVNEGSLLSLPNVGTFTDPGFDNPLNPLAEKSETFTFTIDWGDGTTDSAGAATVDALGSPGVLTAGSFDGSHTYADDGLYTVTITVLDDDGGQDVRTFSVTVSNVAPTLSVVGNQAVNEGSLLSLPNVGTFTDPGFDNPLNPLAEKSETFTFTIDWGDGTADSAGAATVDALGSPGVLTAGSFDGSHTYADDGLYTVTVTVLDDDGGQDVRTFSVTVSNVAPTLVLSVDESLILPIDEGGTTEVNVTGAFSDPGFDNPINTAPAPDGAAPETAETFTYQVDWGDGHLSGPFTLADANGSPASRARARSPSSSPTSTSTTTSTASATPATRSP